MTRKIFFTVFFFLFLMSQTFQAAAQSSSNTPSSGSNFDTTGFPQWAKDMRRFDIIAFGTFPFSWFFVNFFYDMYRWGNANGMDFSAEGRRYAPWPMKSAGAVEMTNDQYRNTLIMAASLSLAIAITDIIIIKIKRKKERRRIESRPAGSVIINKTPHGQLDEELPELKTEDLENLPDDTAGSENLE